MSSGKGRNEMRITNGMLVTNTVRNIGNNTKRLSEASERQSTQCKISLPSDDPIVATNAVKYRNYVSTVAQYEDNAESAISWMDVTASAMSELVDVVQEIRDKTVQAANGTYSESELQDFATELSSLKQSAIDTLNTSYSGRYVFAGYNTDEAPYASTTLTLTKTDGTTVEYDAVTYKGSYVGTVVASDIADDTGAIGDLQTQYTTTGIYDGSTAVTQPIEYNVGFGADIAVNVEGQDAIGTDLGSTLFDTIDKLLLGLTGSTSYATLDSSGNLVTDGSGNVVATEIDLSSLLGDIDTNLATLTSAQADLGARENYTTMAKNRLSDDNTTYTTLMSNNEDVDLAEATTDLSTAQTVYDASLSVGAKAITKTLLDYLA